MIALMVEEVVVVLLLLLLVLAVQVVLVVLVRVPVVRSRSELQRTYANAEHVRDYMGCTYHYACYLRENSPDPSGEPERYATQPFSLLACLSRISGGCSILPFSSVWTCP